jgi:photosystem II stability/assembly factor-like uncharacterized protein
MGEITRLSNKLRPAREFSALLKAASGSILWRAGKGGIIERSADAGKTWVSQVSPTREDWLSERRFPTPFAGWWGATARLHELLMARIGNRFIHPGREHHFGKYPDWVGVTAKDGQAATITGGDQRHYTTANGGQTWQAQ